MVEQKPYLTWNVINKEDFQTRATEVFERVSQTLANTLGPYGATTIIETANDYKVTKDGWNVLKSIHFNQDVEENIVMLLINIAQRVVRKVGDGSTSSVVAANYLLSNLYTLSEKLNIRPRDIIQTLDSLVKKIETNINRKKIDQDGDLEEIFNIAHVSTNGDDEVSKLVHDAFLATRSTAVHFTKSRTYKNELEIIEGYQAEVTYVDPSFVNTDSGTGVYADMDTIIFDHTIEREYHYDFILATINASRSKGKGLLIIAPYFDKPMMESFKALCLQERESFGRNFLVVGRAKYINKHQQNILRDLSALLGAPIVTENIINEYSRQRIPLEDREKSFNTRLTGKEDKLIDTNFESYVGHIGQFTIGKANTLFEDFVNVDEKDLELCRLDASNRLREQQELDEETGLINSDGYFYEDRLSRLSCKTAVIKSGGHTTLEKGANYDLLEDAVKASISAFKDGYTLGGNMSIALACDNLIQTGSLSEIEIKFVAAIRDAFSNVFKNVLTNANLYDVDYEECLAQSAEKGCFNIVTGEHDGKIINPVMTDIEILKGTISIVSLLVSSNQYVSGKPTIAL